MARERCQEFGFEGPDLEMKRHLEIQALACKIGSDQITPVEGSNGNEYHICSQSNPTQQHRVNINAYTCDCQDFPRISFCKHICAVQCHFPEQVEPRSLATIFSISRSATSDLNIGQAAQSDDDTNETLDSTINEAEDNAELLDDICKQLQQLAIRSRYSPPPQLTDTLRALHVALQNATPEFEGAANLPFKQIPPNQHSWPETAAVMGARIKTKRKNHTDPYSGGERSGKKAKEDARGGMGVWCVILWMCWWIDCLWSSLSFSTSKSLANPSNSEKENIPPSPQASLGLPADLNVDQFPPLALVSQAPSPSPLSPSSQLPAQPPAPSHQPAPYTYETFPFTYASNFLERSNKQESVSQTMPLHNNTAPALAVPAVSVPRASGLSLHQLLMEFGCYDRYYAS
jgi:hypothetical protein